jgi:hypothetical protein
MLRVALEALEGDTSYSVALTARDHVIAHRASDRLTPESDFGYEFAGMTSVNQTFGLALEGHTTEVYLHTVYTEALISPSQFLYTP